MSETIYYEKFNIFILLFLHLIILLTAFSTTLQLVYKFIKFESDCKKIIENVNLTNLKKIFEKGYIYLIVICKKHVLKTYLSLVLTFYNIFIITRTKYRIRIENKILRGAVLFFIHCFLSSLNDNSLRTNNNEKEVFIVFAYIRPIIYLYFFLIYFSKKKGYVEKTAYSIFLGIFIFSRIYYLKNEIYGDENPHNLGNPLTLCEIKENLKLDDKVIEILTKNDQIDAIYYGNIFCAIFYKRRWIIMVPEKAVDYNGVILHELKHCLIRKENFYIVRYNIIYIFLTIFGAFFLFYYTKKPSNFAKRFFIFDIFLTIFISKLILFLRNNEENYCDDFAINHGYGKNIALYFIHDILCDVCDENLFPFFGTNFTNLFFDFSVHMPMINRLKKLLNIK